MTSDESDRWCFDPSSMSHILHHHHILLKVLPYIWTSKRNEEKNKQSKLKKWLGWKQYFSPHRFWVDWYVLSQHSMCAMASRTVVLVQFMWLICYVWYWRVGKKRGNSWMSDLLLITYPHRYKTLLTGKKNLLIWILIYLNSFMEPTTTSIISGTIQQLCITSRGQEVSPENLYWCWPPTS